MEILVYEIKNKSASEIFGYPDDLKFHPSLTLFYTVISKHSAMKDDPKYFCFKDAVCHVPANGKMYACVTTVFFFFLDTLTPESWALEAVKKKEREDGK